MAEREIKAVPGDDGAQLNAGQCGNQTAVNVRQAEDAYRVWQQSQPQAQNQSAPSASAGGNTDE